MIRLFAIFLFLFLVQESFSQKNYTTEKTAKSKLLDAFRKGQRLSFNGQFDASVTELEKVLRTDPTFIDAQIEWANVKNQQRNFQKLNWAMKKRWPLIPITCPACSIVLP